MTSLRSGPCSLLSRDPTNTVDHAGSPRREIHERARRHPPPNAESLGVFNRLHRGHRRPASHGRENPLSVSTFSTLRAERIEIVDAGGKVRMLLTGPQKMPGPAGPEDYRPNARKFVAPAIIFYDETRH